MKESNFITSAELKRIIEKGGKNAFYTGWDMYKDSPYAKYERMMRDKESNNEKDAH